MADSLKYNEPASGPTVKTDEVGSDHYQVIKLDLGPDGTAIPVNGSVPVTIVSGTISLPVGAATSALQLADGHNVTVDNTNTNPVIISGAASVVLMMSGIVYNEGPKCVVRYVSVNATSDGDNTIISAVATRKIRILGYVLTTTGLGTFLLQDSNNTVWGRIRSGADGGGASYAGGVDCPAFTTATVNLGIEINCPAGMDMLGHMTYLEVP